MRKSVILALLVIATSIHISAQKDKRSLSPRLQKPAGTNNAPCGREVLSPSAVIAANSRYEAALLASDTEALARFLAQDFLFITASGDSRDRNELLRSYGAKEVRLRVYKSENIRVRFYSSVGILTADVTKDGDYTAGPRAGTVFTGQYRITRVYACGRDGWRLASTHESPLAEKVETNTNEKGMVGRQAVNPPGISPLVPAYSVGIRHGDLVFVSGMTGFKPGTQEINDGGVAAQTQQALENIRATLQSAGATLADVGECTVFLLDIADYAAMNGAYIKFFPSPARATMAVSAFPRPAARVEIKCSAVVQRR